MAFGNVNVDYAPCKSAGQLKAAADNMLGKQKTQIKDGVVKTAPDLYTALGCYRDNFASSILVTRKLQGKSYSRLKKNDILAHKMSISFHPDEQLDYKTAFEIARDFAEKFFHSKGYEVLIAVHTDREHIHAHFLISNCSYKTGKSYRRSQRDLYEMSEYFGEQCLSRGLTKSVRDSFYSSDTSRTKETFAETQMKKRGAESFKDELREAIEIEIADPKNKSFDDVIRSLAEDYNVECRVAGNTVSYRHPQYLDKNGKPVSVRGSKLGDKFTRKGIENELAKKYAAERGAAEYSAGAAELGRIAAALERFVDANREVSSGLGTAGGGQVRNDVSPRDRSDAMRDRSEFYGEGKRRASDDDRAAAPNAPSADGVPKQRKKRGR